MCRRKSSNELGAAREELQQLVDVATPLVDALVPADGEEQQGPFLSWLQRVSGDLRGFIRDAAGACVLQMLSIVKALHPD